MSTTPEMKDAVLEVFRALGLEASEDRKRLRILADLGGVCEEPEVGRYERADTRNNTAAEEDDA